MTEAGNRRSRAGDFQERKSPQNYRPRAADIEKLRAAVIEKSETWHDRYRTVEQLQHFRRRSKLAYESGKGGPSSATPKSCTKKCPRAMC